MISALPPPANLNEARYYWIRVVNTFLDTLEISSASEESKQEIRRPFDKAEAVAERRKKAALKGEAIPDEEDDGEDGTAD